MVIWSVYCPSGRVEFRCWKQPSSRMP